MNDASDPIPLPTLGLALRRLPAPLPVWHGRVDRAQWTGAAQAVAASGGRLVSMWGIDRRAAGGGGAPSAACAGGEGLGGRELALDAADASFPDLAGHFACAGRMQRTMADLSGLRAEGVDDARPWQDHGQW